MRKSKGKSILDILKMSIFEKGLKTFTKNVFLLHNLNLR
jgi:hypothetical protein